MGKRRRLTKRERKALHGKGPMPPERSRLDPERPLHEQGEPGLVLFDGRFVSIDVMGEFVAAAGMDREAADDTLAALIDSGFCKPALLRHEGED